MTENFQNKRALVTGAGSGIGNAIASRLASEGAFVGALDMNMEGAEETVTRLKQHGGAGVALHADVTNKRQVAAAVEKFMQATDGVDVLINCAGAANAEGFDDTDPELWDLDVAINLTGPYLMARAVLPSLIAAGGGSIVNISSVNGIMHFGNPAYSAAKGGLIMFTKSLATEYGKHNIRANAVLPGTIFSHAHEARMKRQPDFMQRLTKWYPLGRVGRVEEVAAAVAFLASDEASFISGAVLTVDGGLTSGLKAMADELTLADGGDD